MSLAGVRSSYEGIGATASAAHAIISARPLAHAENPLYLRGGGRTPPNPRGENANVTRRTPVAHRFVRPDSRRGHYSARSGSRGVDPGRNQGSALCTLLFGADRPRPGPGAARRQRSSARARRQGQGPGKPGGEWAASGRLPQRARLPVWGLLRPARGHRHAAAGSAPRAGMGMPPPGGRWGQSPPRAAGNSPRKAMLVPRPDRGAAKAAVQAAVF